MSQSQHTANGRELPALPPKIEHPAQPVKPYEEPPTLGTTSQIRKQLSTGSAGRSVPSWAAAAGDFGRPASESLNVQTITPESILRQTDSAHDGYDYGYPRLPALIKSPTQATIVRGEYYADGTSEVENDDTETLASPLSPAGDTDESGGGRLPEGLDYLPVNIGQSAQLISHTPSASRGSLGVLSIDKGRRASVASSVTTPTPASIYQRAAATIAGAQQQQQQPPAAGGARRHSHTPSTRWSIQSPNISTASTPRSSPGSEFKAPSNFFAFEPAADQSSTSGCRSQPSTVSAKPLIPAPPLPYTAANTQRPGLPNFPRMAGTVPVFIYTEDDACTMFAVPPNATVNEVRLEALAKLGFSELTESYRIFHMDVMPDGRTVETRVDPNTPVDFFVPPENTPPAEDTTSSPSSATLPFIKLRMRRKSTVKWNVRIELENKVQRNVIVDAGTTAEEVLKVLFMVEGIDEAEREGWGLLKESLDNTGEVSKVEVVNPTEAPFIPWDRTTKFVFKRLAAKRAAKVSNMLGIPSNVDVNALMTKQAAVAEDLKRVKEAYRSSKLSKVLGITSDEDYDGAKAGQRPFPPRQKRPPMREGVDSFDEEMDERRMQRGNSGTGDLDGTDVEMNRRSWGFSSNTGAGLWKMENEVMHALQDAGKKKGSRPGSASSATAYDSGDLLGSGMMKSDSLHSQDSARWGVQPATPPLNIVEFNRSGSLGSLDRESRDTLADPTGMKGNANKPATMKMKVSRSTDSFKALVGSPKSWETRRTSASSIAPGFVMSPEPNREPAKRTAGKLADFFGVKKGQRKELDEISKIVIRNRTQQEQKTTQPEDKNSWIARIYFGNLTYTSITLPITAPASLGVKIVLERLGIKENNEEYAMFEYQQGSATERQITPDEQMYDIMIRWRDDEIFLFKRKSTKNLLRHKPTEHEQAETPELTHSDSTTNLDPAVPAKRVAKLAGFFGVDDSAGGTGANKMSTNPSGLRSAQGTLNRRHAKKGGRMEVEELCKMLNVLSQDWAKSLDSKPKQQRVVVNKLYKEGWIHKYKEDSKQKWTPCWGKLENCLLTLRPTASKDEAINDHITITLNLDQSTVETCAYGVYKRAATFVVITRGGEERHVFAAGSQVEMDEWVNSIKVSSRVGGQRVEVMVEEKLVRENSGIRRSIASGSASSDRSTTSLDVRGSRKMTIADFEIHKVLGRGKFAKVLLCSRKSTSKVYAIKVLDKFSEDDDCYNPGKESAILRSVQHPFIVGLHYAFQSKERLYLVMEYVNGGELYFHVSNFGRFSEERVRFYGAELLLALEYLHEKDVVYRDLKLENILLAKDGHVKITDFGLSKQEDVNDDDSDTVSVVGTLEYLAPEVLQGLENSFAADWWAYGVVLFEMLCGFHPFYSDDREMIRENIITAEVEYPGHVSDDAMDLIARLLCRTPAKRLGCGPEGGKEIMGHDFYIGVDFDRLLKKEIEVPFKPELTDDFDVSFFDEVFTTEDPLSESSDDLYRGGTGMDSMEFGDSMTSLSRSSW
ncbi:RAC-alpha serine/threonine-protein kinase [Borealophlyctis nickersoniae]|nr:RAC-alpha serine/threonine-protein kinase [Borealophlyctis nickersoniae]